MEIYILAMAWTLINKFAPLIALGIVFAAVYFFGWKATFIFVGVLILFFIVVNIYLYLKDKATGRI